MYNHKDIQFVGKHDFDKENAITGLNITFSIGIFKWVLAKDGKSMKKSKSIVRVKGFVSNKKEVFKYAENIVKDLDLGNWGGRKTVVIK